MSDLKLQKDVKVTVRINSEMKKMLEDDELSVQKVIDQFIKDNYIAFLKVKKKRRVSK